MRAEILGRRSASVPPSSDVITQMAPEEASGIHGLTTPAGYRRPHGSLGRITPIADIDVSPGLVVVPPEIGEHPAGGKVC